MTVGITITVTLALAGVIHIIGKRALSKVDNTIPNLKSTVFELERKQELDCN